MNYKIMATKPAYIILPDLPKKLILKTFRVISERYIRKQRHREMDKLKKNSRFHQTFHDFPTTRKVAAEKQMLSKKSYKDIEVGRVSKLTILS